jgi:DinB superfamily
VTPIAINRRIEKTSWVGFVSSLTEVFDGDPDGPLGGRIGGPGPMRYKESMPIVPETKDWTWVLERPCEECGFDTASFPRELVGELIRANAAEWTELLEHPQVRTRPSDDRWSALEYACHVRDVFLLYDQRLEMMLEQDDPSYPNWDQDKTAVEDDYASADPATVAAEIRDAGEALATRFDSVSGDGWARTGNRSDGARFTVETFARYLVHDPIHHVMDVRRGYDSLRNSTG